MVIVWNLVAIYRHQEIRILESIKKVRRIGSKNYKEQVKSSEF